MAYKVYSGPRGASSLSPIDKDRMLFKQFVGLEDAMAWARHVVSDGRAVLLIEGDDGTRIERHDIGAALQIEGAYSS